MFSCRLAQIDNARYAESVDPLPSEEKQAQPQLDKLLFIYSQNRHSTLSFSS